MRVLSCVNDVFFMAKIEAITKRIPELEYISGTFLDANTSFNYIILNLEEEGALTVVRAFPAKTLCFYSHVNTNVMKQAQELGCINVFPRSKFFQELPMLMK